MTGSKIHGGRFNVGDSEDTSIKDFGALYIANKKETAIIEVFGSSPEDDPRMNTLEFALTRDENISIFSLKGFLESYIDLTTDEALLAFLTVTKKFEIRNYVNDLAKRLEMPLSSIVKTPKKLRQTILDPRFREAMALFDVPSNSQILGSLVRRAGIEGILYNSIKKKKDLCLALFIDNFKNTSSFIEIMGQCASTVKPTRVDSSNCLDFL